MKVFEVAPFIVTGVKWGKPAGKVAIGSFKTLSELGLRNGMEVTESEALILGQKFLGAGYKKVIPSSGRYVSADGTRAFRMGDADILGKHWKGNHVNFEAFIPNPLEPVKLMVDENIHIYIY
jgi:hypothetical protein